MPLSVVKAVAGDLVRWGVTDSPPLYITKGEHQGKGVSDRYLNFFIDHMQDMDHQKVVMTMPRFRELVEDGVNLCFTSLRKTPTREGYLTFSQPISAGQSPRIYVREDSDILKRAENGSVSLREILVHNEWKGLFRKGRSWGKRLDTLLNNAPESRIVYLVSVGTKVKQLCAGRADYFLEYPFVVDLAFADKNSEKCLRELKIREEVPYVDIFVGCTKNEWGERVVQRVNEIVKVEKRSPEYRCLFDFHDIEKIGAGNRDRDDSYQYFLRTN